MKALFTIHIDYDGGDEIVQEIAVSPAEALEQWTQRHSQGGIIDSLSSEEWEELKADFSVSRPTLLGIGAPVDGLKGVWRAGTVLESGKSLEVVCVRCAVSRYPVQRRRNRA
jgi:hypothetical protein